jgi:hypothetical protein
MAEIDWKREFDGLGAGGVRGALIATRWDKEKRAAAREWLERADGAAWQGSRAGRPDDAPAKSTLDAFRRFKWVYYVVGAGFGLFALAQMLKF